MYSRWTDRRYGRSQGWAWRRKLSPAELPALLGPEVHQSMQSRMFPCEGYRREVSRGAAFLRVYGSNTLDSSLRPGCLNHKVHRPTLVIACVHTIKGCWT